MLRWLLAAFLLIVNAGPGSAAGQPAAVLDAITGHWQGLAVDGKRLRLAIDRRGDGFTLEIGTSGALLASTGFRPAAKPGVFEPIRDEGLFGMFARRSTKPLHEQPVIWARLAEHGLVVYRLAVDSAGRMALNRFDVHADGAQVTLSVMALVPGGERLSAQARLERE